MPGVLCQRKRTLEGVHLIDDIGRVIAGLPLLRHRQLPCSLAAAAQATAPAKYEGDELPAEICQQIPHSKFVPEVLVKRRL